MSHSLCFWHTEQSLISSLGIWRKRFAVVQIIKLELNRGLWNLKGFLPLCGCFFLVDCFDFLFLKQREAETQYKIFTCKCILLRHNHLAVQSDFYKYCILCIISCITSQCPIELLCGKEQEGWMCESIRHSLQGKFVSRLRTQFLQSGARNFVQLIEIHGLLELNM